MISTFICNCMISPHLTNPDHGQQPESEPSCHRVSMAVQLGGKGFRAEKLRGAHLWPVEYHYLCVSASCRTSTAIVTKYIGARLICPLAKTVWCFRLGKRFGKVQGSESLLSLLGQHGSCSVQGFRVKEGLSCLISVVNQLGKAPNLALP